LFYLCRCWGWKKSYNIRGNSFEYIVCTKQHELKSKSNWLR
jgi:hypothetical protein